MPYEKGYDVAQLSENALAATTNLQARKSVEFEQVGSVCWLNIDGICVARVVFDDDVNVVIKHPAEPAQDEEP